MKKLFNVIVLIFSIICLYGCSCSKVNFAYFKDKVNNITDYKYYAISQEIYNNELLLYKEDKNVYLNDEKYRILVNTKEIADLESENLYNEKEEEYYQSGNEFYYKENNEWKTKEVEKSVGIGFDISESLFKKYQIKEEKGNKLFVGELKQEQINNFLGFEISDANNMKFNIEISNKDKVKKVSLEYVANNGNKVIVSVNVGYVEIVKFELPVLG